MTGKIGIVRHLGEEELLLPALLADALAANDRLKLRLTMLQEAGAHARHPEQGPLLFEDERRQVGLADAAFDAMIAGAKAVSAERLVVPGAKALLAGLATDLAAMLAPLKAGDMESYRPLSERLAALAAAMPPAEGDDVAFADIDAMTSARRGGADSVHLLVMDAHKAINRLAADSAVETIDGARVQHLDAQDRARVKAFMAGLNRTAPLAFGHPGLGTTAVRTGTRLTIQNDIGTTDAHVLVVHVEDSTVSITYTDVHRQRARFFISLFEGEEVEWNKLAEQTTHALAEGDVFYLLVGRFAATDEAAVNRFLEFLGSRIVFLIDWNKARKAIQTFAGKAAAIDILRWAAQHDCGHRAFLELGGADLVFDAIRRMADGRIPYGARLDDTLGASESTKFLQHVLQQSSEGLRAGRSIRLIRDEIQADLAQLFDTAESAVLMVLLRHLGVTRMLAATIAEAFAQDRIALDFGRSELAGSAKRMEEKADRLTLQAREICARLQRGSGLRQVVDHVENATDALDESAFLLSLVPAGHGIEKLATVAELADVVIDSIGNLVRATEAASHLPQGYRTDATDALQAIDAVVTAERWADTTERDVITAFMRTPAADARSLVLGLEVARTLETATDHLAHAALALRDRVLEELSA